MKVLVCGGRDFNDQDFLFKKLDEVDQSAIGTWADGITLIIHGAARGADSLAGMWAHKRGIGVKRYPADWKQYGRAAGPIRNRQMLVEESPDLVVAFPGGSGTANMVKLAQRAGIRVQEIVR